MSDHLNDLVSEYIGELHAEIERLMDENRKMNTTLAKDAIEIFEREREIERLRANKAELLAALRPFAAPTVSDYESQEQRAARAAIARVSK